MIRIKLEYRADMRLGLVQVTSGTKHLLVDLKDFMRDTKVDLYDDDNRRGTLLVPYDMYKEWKVK